MFILQLIPGNVFTNLIFDFGAIVNHRPIRFACPWRTRTVSEIPDYFLVLQVIDPQ